MINVMTINTSSLTAGVIDENTSFQKNIVPANKVPLKFKMKIEEQKRKAALAESENSGKTPKDIEWDMFISSKMKMNDDEIAIQHLDKYIDICATEGINVENLCYEYILRKKQDAYDIQQNIKVGGKQYDIIARSKKDSKDILYEVKYWKDKKTFGKIKTVVEKEKDKITTYELIEQRTTYDKILIVLPDDVYEETVSMHKTLKKAGTENIEVCIFRFSDIDKEY